MPDKKFGTRFFTILLLKALREYLRHEDGINQDLTTAIIDALAVLVANMPAIEALNQPGPR